MAIAFSKYIQITSGVGAGVAVARRELIGRLFTINPLVPTGSILEFTTLADVGAYFGTTSEEYKRASYYFSFINKNINAPNKISYARWVNADAAPRIYGAALQTTLTALNLITDGAFSLTLGGVTNLIGGLDFSGAGSLSAVATIIQAAIRSETGTQWTAATVTYDATRSSFDFVGGSAVVAVVSVAAPGSGTNISHIIGWLPEAINGAGGAIWSNGKLAETITEVLTASTELSNNFGSFLFQPSLTLDQIIEAATWNSAIDQNVLFQYMVPVTAANASSYSAALINFAGVGLTLTSTAVANEYQEQMPMEILAATNYDAVNSVQNYMFYQFNRTPTVLTTVDSNFYDNLRINYYGRTQQAGRFLDFYQRGVLTGLAVNPVDMNVYANEQWLKDAAGVIIMQLLLALSKVSANTQGRIQILTVLQAAIDQALANGSISVGKILNDVQKLYISNITNDPNAWYQVQNIGYWLNCTIESFITSDSRVEFKATYTLVYSKDDVIRKVEGTHNLI